MFNAAGRTSPRVSAVFQIHTPMTYKDPTNRFDPEMWSWLQQDHGFPIYMLEDDPLVPNCTPYPLKEILDAFPCERRMFTQSSCYALALALFYDYERVLIYGIENMHYSEYSPEREGFIYWVGFVQGRGVKVERYCGDNMFDNPLYGRERLWEQNPDKYAAKLGGYEMELRKRTRELAKAKGGKFETWNEALYHLGIINGRREMSELYYGRVKAMVKATGRAILVPGELKIDRRDLLETINEGRNIMERARGANNLEAYAEAALKTATLAGRMMEVDDMIKEAEDYMAEEIKL
jgi:hypothetical protein